MTLAGVLEWIFWVVLFAVGTIVVFTLAWRWQDRYIDRRDRQHREALQRAKEGETDHDGQR